MALVTLAGFSVTVILFLSSYGCSMCGWSPHGLELDGVWMKGRDWASASDELRFRVLVRYASSDSRAHPPSAGALTAASVVRYCEAKPTRYEANRLQIPACAHPVPAQGTRTYLPPTREIFDSTEDFAAWFPSTLVLRATPSRPALIHARRVHQAGLRPWAKTPPRSASRIPRPTRTRITQLLLSSHATTSASWASTSSALPLRLRHHVLQLALIKTRADDAAAGAARGEHSRRRAARESTVVTQQRAERTVITRRCEERTVIAQRLGSVWSLHSARSSRGGSGSVRSPRLGSGNARRPGARGGRLGQREPEQRGESRVIAAGPREPHGDGDPTGSRMVSSSCTPASGNSNAIFVSSDSFRLVRPRLSRARRLMAPSTARGSCG
ncbi:hypothetical protein C8J57DRAFT_1467779 [Mycena rebaudengoi]|nr:hypothetical protein C8J57DRAFT_1467779 [Mycena rebaudengoi]